MPRAQNALRPALAAAAQAQLRDSGWVCLPGVIPAEGLGALHASWDRLCAGVPADDLHNWGPPNLDDDPAFRDWLEGPRVAAAVAFLIGPEPTLREVHGRSPPQGHGRQGIHADWPVPVAVDGQLFANAFLILDPMDAENGGTRVVPGSHRWYQVPRGAVAQPLAHHPQERIVEASPGDVLVFSAHLWHGGTENRSGRRRRVAMGRYARSGVSALPSDG